MFQSNFNGNRVQYHFGSETWMVIPRVNNNKITIEWTKCFFGLDTNFADTNPALKY